MGTDSKACVVAGGTGVRGAALAVPEESPTTTSTPMTTTTTAVAVAAIQVRRRRWRCCAAWRADALPRGAGDLVAGRVVCWVVRRLPRGGTGVALLGVFLADPAMEHLHSKRGRG